MSNMSPYGPQRLRVINHGDLVDAESVSSGPPPGYTFQQDADSPGTTGKYIVGVHSINDDSPVSGAGGESALPLPSPYSTEDLLSGLVQYPDSRTMPSAFPFSGPGQNYVNSHSLQVHGHPTIEAPQRKHTVRTTSHPSASSVATHSSANHVHAQLFPSPSSLFSHPPRRNTYQGHPSEPFPAAVGYLTYHPGDTTNGDVQDIALEDPTLHATNLNGSSVAFAERSPYRPQNPDESPAESHGNPTLTQNPSAAAYNVSAAQARATNYVSLSRKSTYRCTRFSLLSSQREMRTTSITGSFTIDPRLRIPAGLLKAVHSPASDLAGSKSRIETFAEQQPQDARYRKKNLMLEVENGGINVDIDLIPSSNNPLASASRIDVNARPGARTSVDKSSSTIHLHRRPSLNREQSTRRSELIPRKPHPTLIDLRLNSSPARGRKAAGSQKRIFALVARIDAPQPRPSFHLFASTIDDMPSPPVPKVPTRPKSHEASPRPLPWPKSPVTLYLPRTFHGPISIHVGVGNVEAHVRLSKELLEAAVVLSETAFSRGYFIGGLAVFRDPENISDGWELVEELEEEEPHKGLPAERAGLLAQDCRNGERHHTDHPYASTASETPSSAQQTSKPCRYADSEDRDEWFGDKIEVLVGGGKVYLQYLDEEEPFGRPTGFWRKIRFGS